MRGPEMAPHSPVRGRSSTAPWTPVYYSADARLPLRDARLGSAVAERWPPGDLDLHVVAGLEGAALLRRGDHLHPHGCRPGSRRRRAGARPRRRPGQPCRGSPPPRAPLPRDATPPAGGRGDRDPGPPTHVRRGHRDARAAGGVHHHAQIRETSSTRTATRLAAPTNSARIGCAGASRFSSGCPSPTTRRGLALSTRIAVLSRADRAGRQARGDSTGRPRNDSWPSRRGRQPGGGAGARGSRSGRGGGHRRRLAHPVASGGHAWAVGIAVSSASGRRRCVSRKRSAAGGSAQGGRARLRGRAPALRRRDPAAPCGWR